MSIKPILFNTEMVRAILNGWKTCTRRLVSSRQFLGMLPDKCKNAAPDDFLKGKRMTFKPYCDMTDAELIMTAYKAPYEPGNILYVRETWKKAPNGYYYYEDWQRNDIADVTKWKPSIHMPKEAARIWLKVTDVRVERLQEITDNECIKEGIYPSNCRDCNDIFGCDVCPDEGYDEVDKFVEVWNSTIKKSDLNRYGWDANPWVWVISFERCEKPEGVKK
jgi:hypothetical protein|nr:hypothetical protein [Roseburia inulinivorans]DAW40670.1 MAG TPA: ASCH domain protein [Caudoviricetes sp.]